MRRCTVSVLDQLHGFGVVVVGLLNFGAEGKPNFMSKMHFIFFMSEKWRHNCTVEFGKLSVAEYCMRV
jgi:hypothetical protein